MNKNTYKESCHTIVGKPDVTISANEYQDLLMQVRVLEGLLDKSDKRIAELEAQLRQQEHIFVGYTNAYQVEYAKTEEGAFYPDNDNDCYIPLYMLKIHEHRAHLPPKEQNE